MFYRHSEMFVRFLKNYDTDKFKKLLDAVQNNRTFNDAVHTSYEVDIDKLWLIFLEKLLFLFPPQGQ